MGFKDDGKLNFMTQVMSSSSFFHVNEFPHFSVSFGLLDKEYHYIRKSGDQSKLVYLARSTDGEVASRTSNTSNVS